MKKLLLVPAAIAFGIGLSLTAAQAASPSGGILDALKASSAGQQTLVQTVQHRRHCRRVRVCHGRYHHRRCHWVVKCYGGHH